MCTCESERVTSVSISSGSDSPSTLYEIFPDFGGIEMHAEEHFPIQMPFHLNHFGKFVTILA